LAFDHTPAPTRATAPPVSLPAIGGRGSYTDRRPGGARIRNSFAGAAVPVPDSCVRAAGVLAGGTQFHFVFNACIGLRALAGASEPISSGSFEFWAIEKTERST